MVKLYVKNFTNIAVLQGLNNPQNVKKPLRIIHKGFKHIFELISQHYRAGKSCYF